MAEGTPVVVTTDTEATPCKEVASAGTNATRVVERDRGTPIRLAGVGQPVYFPEGSPQ